MTKWLQALRARAQARRLEIEQQRRLAEHARKEREDTARFLFGLGDRMHRESLPPRCAAVYEMVLNWSQDDTFKIKQAALYLFMWELEEKRASMSWEVDDIALEIEQMILLRKPAGESGDLATQ